MESQKNILCLLFQVNLDDNLPQGICEQCTSHAITSYHFKITCQKANSTLSHIMTSHPSPNLPDIDLIDINVIHQDHEYEIPLMNNPSFNLIPNILSNDLTITPVPLKEVPQTVLAQPKEEKDKPFKCTLCSSAFTKVYGLQDHMNKHVQPHKKLCQLCGKCFNTIGNLKQHILTHKGARFKCCICDKAYKSRQAVREHYRLAHSNNRYAYTCAQCNKSFTVKASLTHHLKIHEPERQLFACLQCPKKYTKVKYLRAHSKVHTDEGPLKRFCCNYSGCDRKYATKHSLLLHISYTHTDNRPYVCDVCSKSFVTLLALRKHRELHDKNTVCKICDLKMINKNEFKNHMKEHEKEC